MSLFTRLLASALRGILFFGAFDFALAGVRSRVACFFAGLILLEPLVVTLDALRAGTFAAVERFIIDLGRADLALMARPFDDVLAVDRRDAAGVTMSMPRAHSHVMAVNPESGRPVGILSTLDIAGVLAWGEM